MSEDRARHLPPEALDDWLTEISGPLGIEEEIDVAAVLDLTRDVAHDVARPAAPLTTFALGLALGRRPEAEFEQGFRDMVERLTALAAERRES